MNECIIPNRKTTTFGYVMMPHNGKYQPMHRVAYEIANGPIAEGLFVDHECHNEAAARGECQGGNCEHRKCINPDHLRLTTPQENTLAGLHSIATRGGFKCGHEMIEANIMTRKNGHRECAECNRQRARANYRKVASK